MTKFKADLGLMSITVFWGSTFVISKFLLQDIPVAWYLTIRFSLAAVILNLIFIHRFRNYSKPLIRDGMLLGIILFFTFFFQMWGIRFTTASNAGFITGLSVLLVPVLGFILSRSKPAPNVGLGIILALAGLLLLTGANPLDWNKGDYLVLACTLFVAIHIIYTGKVAGQHDIYLLTGTQLITLSILSLLMAFISDNGEVILTVYHWSGLIYLAVFATVFTYLMQTAMQRFTTPARTALIFALEPVFAALFAMLFSDEQLGGSEWLGGLMIVLSMILAEIPLDRLFNSGASDQA